jgi:hypothetical protein
MPTYTVHVVIPFRTPAGRELETDEHDIILEDPPQPKANLELNVLRFGRRMRVPLNLTTVDAEGRPWPDGTRFEITWPNGVELPPDNVEVASVERPDGTSMQVVKEIYRG